MTPVHPDDTPDFDDAEPSAPGLLDTLIAAKP
jgi:hypothetical protein